MGLLPVVLPEADAVSETMILGAAAGDEDENCAIVFVFTETIRRTVHRRDTRFLAHFFGRKER